MTDKAPHPDLAVLEALYGELDPGRTAYPGMVQEDFGIQESTVRMALKRGTRVEVPLRAILPFVDVQAFRAHRARRTKRD